MKYLFILEDNSFYKTDEFTDDEKRAVDEGLMDVIDIQKQQFYLEGHWHEIEVFSSLGRMDSLL